MVVVEVVMVEVVRVMDVCDGGGGGGGGGGGDESNSAESRSLGLTVCRSADYMIRILQSREEGGKVWDSVGW